MTGVQLVHVEELWLRWEQKLGILNCARKKWLIRQQLSERNTTEYSIELRSPFISEASCLPFTLDLIFLPFI